MPTCGSPGPASSARPSTLTHSPPTRKLTVTCGRARRFAILARPQVTNPTTCSPVTGCARTPALMTDDWIVASARTVETTARNRSRRPIAIASSRVAIFHLPHPPLVHIAARGHFTAQGWHATGFAAGNPVLLAPGHDARGGAPGG